MIDSLSLPEDWRPVADTGGNYAASTWGRIKRLVGGRGSKAGTILSPVPFGKGYLKVTLCVNGERLQRLVHVVVAKTWIGDPPSPAHEVNHKDGVKAHCHVSNLEYLTPLENNLHSIHVLHKKMPGGENHCRAKLTDAQCDEARRRVLDGGDTRADVAADLGVSAAQISRIVSGLSR